MCQLFALTCSSPVSPDFSLRGFFQRGGKTGDHADGWGLALFSQGKADIQTHQSAAHNCQQVSYLLESKPKATTVVAHIRKATVGQVSPENTHPFVRNLWGETWAFAHNGDLEDFYPESGPVYHPSGQTDSERAFCYILNRLAERFTHKPDLVELSTYLKTLSQYIARQGTFNFILSNGSFLITHCSTELYWTRRHPPYGQLTLLDTQVSVDLSEINNKGQTMVVLATKPLTRGEAWYPMGRGEIRVFENGQLTHDLLPDASAHKTPYEWNQAWSSKKIILS